MRIDATGWFVRGSTAVAVCVLLCGSTPMTIIATVLLSSASELPSRD
jgi:hypothetical protein